jgi:ABC-type antimicrobial peptide transport system permease subunit
MAIHALRRNVMRSALTTLGIIIGVAAVIAMTEIGQGSNKAVANTIKSMGADNLLIQSGAASSGGATFGSGSVLTLTPDDARAIARECSAVEAVAPIVRARTTVVYGNKNWVPVYIYGTTPEFLDVREWELVEGEPFSQRDVEGAARVCMIGQTLVRELFADESPVGREVRLNNVMLRVVGVLERKGANMMGVDQDDILLAPWTTIKYRVAGTSATTAIQTTQAATTDPTQKVNTLNVPVPGTNTNQYVTQTASQQANNPQPIRFTNVDQILCRAQSTRDIPLAIEQITQLLHERHRIKPGQPDDFNIRDMTEMTKALGASSATMTRSLFFVALVSLLVGGVGIMNIMLVSVTERTREIGLRMAVGARARDILRQFLVEAVVLCLLGGFIGILVGRGVAVLMNLMLKWPTEMSIEAIVGAVLVSAGVGVVFGYYPAWKASRLDPIDALRYE